MKMKMMASPKKGPNCPKNKTAALSKGRKERKGAALALCAFQSVGPDAMRDRFATKRASRLHKRTSPSLAVECVLSALS